MNSASTTQNHDGIEFYRRLSEGNEAGCRDLLQHRREIQGASVIELCEALAEALHLVGDAWECAELTVYREHLASQIGYLTLQDLRSAIPAPSTRAPIAIGCAPERDPYRLPTLMVELVLRDLGWSSQSFGCNLPLELLTPAFRELRPKLCWVSVSHVDSEDRLRQQLLHTATAAARYGVKVICGGQGLSPEIRKEALGVTFLGELREIAPFLEAPSGG